MAMVPFLVSPIESNAAFERSKALDEWYGPLSLTLTTTLFPEIKLVTFTSVPKGSVLLAAINSLLIKIYPLDVFLPLNLSW